jgi:CheY-like chemotaxis protein
MYHPPDWIRDGTSSGAVFHWDCRAEQFYVRAGCRTEPTRLRGPNCLLQSAQQFRVRSCVEVSKRYRVGCPNVNSSSRSTGELRHQRRTDPEQRATLEVHVKVRVFVVEDLHNIRVLLNDLLASRAGFEVVGTATTEAEANLWLEENSGEWDLVIADLILAQGSGISVVRRAVQSRNSGKVVVLSGYATEGIRKHLLELGVDRVFDKANTDEFVRWIETMDSPDASGPASGLR